MVSADQTSSGFIVYDNASQTVLAGGWALATHVRAGGSQDVFGFARGATLSSALDDPAVQRIEGGGSAFSTRVGAGSLQEIENGGLAQTIFLNGVAVSGADSFATQEVESGGVASATAIRLGG